jgi:hypothetical protein
MELDDNQYVCEWCARGFVRRYERGRRPLYCGRTCRQRAYEDRRRGAWMVGLPKPTVVRRLRPLPKHYQSGVGGYSTRVVHAMRPDGAADYIGFRPTLCGTRVKPSPFPFYEQANRAEHCETCTRVARHFPPERNIDPVGDVGTATSLISALRATRFAPEPVLRAQVDQLLGAFGAPAGAAPRLPPRVVAARAPSAARAPVAAVGGVT